MMEPDIEPTTSDLQLLACVLADDMEGVEDAAEKDAVEKDAAEEDAQAGEEDAEEDAQAGEEDADDAEEEVEDADDDEEEEEDAAEEVEKTLILPPTRRRAPSPQQHRKRKVQHCDHIPSKKARRRNLPTAIPISAIWELILKFNITNAEMRRDYLKSFEFNDDTIDEEAISSLQRALYDTIRNCCAIGQVFQDTRDVKTFSKKDLMRCIDNPLMRLVLGNISYEELIDDLKSIIKEYDRKKGRLTLTDEE